MCFHAPSKRFGITIMLMEKPYGLFLSIALGSSMRDELISQIMFNFISQNA
jgi:hypothetical protein